MKFEISEKGLNLIKRFEGCRLTAYKPVASEALYTIGWGHYGVEKDTIITQAEADSLLKEDIKLYERFVNECVNGYGLTWVNQNMFDALVSFTYNCGHGNLIKLLKEGRRTAAQVSETIPAYNKAGGKTLQGLVNRRAAEKELFDTPVGVKSVDDLAHEVIAGNWGNGAARRISLTQAGYNYNEVQKRVNEILRR